MSSKTKSSKSKSSSESKPGPRSRNQIIKESFGNRPNFQYSYGLKMGELKSELFNCLASCNPKIAGTAEPDDIEEGNRILDAF